MKKLTEDNWSLLQTEETRVSSVAQSCPERDFE